MNKSMQTVFGSGKSLPVESCQVCGANGLQSLLFLGYLPPVNSLRPIGQKLQEEMSYPAEWLYCGRCHLVQLGCVVDPKIIFPASYPYTSSTTKILRENFAELYDECSKILHLKPEDLIVDIGSNDGNLLSNFTGKHRVIGVTPENIGTLAVKRGIPTILDYFSDQVAKKILSEQGQARLVTATNVFAHMENINAITASIVQLLDPEGVFISESHYLLPLIETLQYDTIYHEHLRYYSLHSLKFLLEAHGLEVVHAKQIPTHGGSIRVYAARKGVLPVRDTVSQLLKKEKETVTNPAAFKQFQKRVAISKLELQSMLHQLKQSGKSICGISAPSRASTLISYVGIDEYVLNYVCEVNGSHKIGKYVPGTVIPILDESRLFQDQPDYALLLSWHITSELCRNLKNKGYRGDFIVPLPKPAIIKNSDVQSR